MTGATCRDDGPYLAPRAAATRYRRTLHPDGSLGTGEEHGDGEHALTPLGWAGLSRRFG
jgi:hypothetical protein